MSAVSIFSGQVAGVVYENEDFRIIRIVLDDDPVKTPITAKGNFPAQRVVTGSWVSFEGSWKNHPQYGRQITVTRSPVAVSQWTDDRVMSALSSEGVGPTTRGALMVYAVQMGVTLQELMDSGDLSGVSVLDELAQTHAISRWRSLRTYLDAAAFMADAGLPNAVVGKVWKTFGTDIEAVITSDPWVLVRVAGVSFKQADEIAVRLGVNLDNPGRVRGAVLTAIQETVREGHVFASTGQVVSWVNKTIPRPPVQSSDIVAAIKDLRDQKALVVDMETHPGLTALYDPWHHQAEIKCADILAEKARHPVDPEALAKALCRVGDKVRDAQEAGGTLEDLASAALDTWAHGKKISLTNAQRQAAIQALISPVSVLTGLPGTGKTTDLMAVVSVARDMGIPFLLVAPTGIAAKRMSTITGSDAATIHRAFGARGFTRGDQERKATYVGIVGESKKKESSHSGSEEWEHGPGNPHPARMIILDESSMLDLHMLYRLLTATSPDCRIVFVGDPYQLPSVGSGDVLRDLVRSRQFPHAHLTQIFRQENTSGIILAAHDVHAGRTPTSDGKDFVLLHASDEENASDLIVSIARKLYDKKANFQVLSPRHGGDAGVTTLNHRLRLALNPASSGVAEMRLGGSVVREGDRIMVVKNDYNMGVYNGDVGKVARIDRRAKEIEIKIFEGTGLPPRIIKYGFADASRALRLAYAQTVHKSQGQEYDVIVVPVLPSFGRQLQRNLFYTAITRAKKKVLLVGTSSAIARAVSNNRAEKRNTLLAERLIERLGKGGVEPLEAVT